MDSVPKVVDGKTRVFIYLLDNSYKQLLIEDTATVEVRPWLATGTSPGPRPRVSAMSQQGALLWATRMRLGASRSRGVGAGGRIVEIGCVPSLARRMWSAKCA